MDRNPIAGLAAIRSWKSDSSYVETRITRCAAPSAVELPREVEAVFGTELDVDEHDVGPEGLGSLQRFEDRGCDADDRRARPARETASSLEELNVVIDDQAANGHDSVARIAPFARRMAYRLAGVRDWC